MSRQNVAYRRPTRSRSLLLAFAALVFCAVALAFVVRMPPRPSPPLLRTRAPVSEANKIPTVPPKGTSVVKASKSPLRRSAAPPTTLPSDEIERGGGGDDGGSPLVVTASPQVAPTADSGGRDGALAGSAYCSQRQPWWDNVRSLALPNDQVPPVSVDASAWEAAARPHVVAFALEGNAPVDGLHTASALAAHVVPSGWHCVVMRDQHQGCIAATQPFIVLDKSRGDSEYGVPASFLKRLPFRVAVPLQPAEPAETSAADGHGTVSVSATGRGQSILGSVALSAAPIQRDPVERTTVEQQRTVFRAAAASLVQKAGHSTTSQHEDASFLLRHTPTVPAGTLGILLVSLVHGVPATMSARRQQNLKRQAAFGRRRLHHASGIRGPSLGAPVMDFVRLYLQSPLPDGDSTVTEKPVRWRRNEEDPRAKSFAAEADDWVLDVFGGLGSGLLRPSGKGQRVPWVPEHPLTGGVANTLKVAFHTFGDKDDGQQDSVAMQPSWVDRRVSFAKLDRFTPAKSSDELRHALARCTVDSDIASGHASCLIHVTAHFTITEALVIEKGTVVAVEPGVIIKVAESLTIRGTPDAVVLFTRAQPLTERNAQGGELNEKSIHAGNWGGLSVARTGAVVATHTVFAFAGGSTKRAKGTGTHIKDGCPIVVAEPGARVTLNHSALVHSRGPGIGAGEASKAVIYNTLFHDLAQGGECVGCDVELHRCVLANFMLRPVSKEFVDRDNDGFYFRGGHGRVTESVIVNTLDDCIDSASSKGDSVRSSLSISDSVIANCQHEGIALSASAGTHRDVTIDNTLIAFTQQGIENGHTPATHMAMAQRVTFVGNQIGARHGDNYELEIKGKFDVVEAVFRNNNMDVLNAVMRNIRKTGSVRTLGVPPEGAVLGGSAEFVTVRRSVFIRPSRAGSQAMDRASLRLRQGVEKDRKAIEDGLMAMRSRVLAADDTRYVFPKVGPAYSSVDVQRGLVCGTHHFTSDENAVLDSDKEGGLADAGCAISRLCDGDFLPH
jgi:hypothetical protein